MADKKISELNSILGSLTADDDLLVIVDSSTNETKKITKAELASTINAALIDGAPAALDTLNELAAALADDANFASTVTNSIATKVSKSGDTMTGDLTVPNVIVSGNVDGRDVSADGAKLDGIESGADVTDTANVTAAGAVMTSGSTMTGNLNFGDNDKAQFGAGSDLQISHNGSNSLILDLGDGALYLGGNEEVIITNGGATEYKARFVSNGTSELYYDNSKKLATTSTGVDVTGTVTADGLTVDGGDVSLNGGASGSDTYLRFKENSPTIGYAGFYLHLDGTDDDLYIGRHDTADQLVANDKPAIGIDRGTGDISFYEDTGTTPKFFWDASTERLGIGTSSPQYTLDLRETAGTQALQILASDFTAFGATSGSNLTTLKATALGSNGAMAFATGAGTERMRIDSSGNLLIGDTTTTGFDGTSGVKISNSGPALLLDKTGAGAQAWLQYIDGNGSFVIYDSTNNNNRMAIDSSGNVGIGVSSLVSGSTRRVLQISTGSDGGQIALSDSTTEAANPRIFATNKSDLKLSSANSGSSTIQFITGTTPAERARIDSSGNVGIGTSSPLAALHVTTSTTDYTGDVVISGTRPYLVFDDITAGQNGFSIGVDGGAVTFGQGDFSTNSNVYGTERARIDSSGNLLVGTTAFPSGSNAGFGFQTASKYAYFARSGGEPLNLDRHSSNGDIVAFRKDGSTVGSIAVTNALYIGQGDTGLAFFQPDNLVFPAHVDSLSGRDNIIDLGNSFNRFDDIYATNGTIQTSDRNEKQDIASLTDAEMRVAKRISAMFKKFRWIDSVEAKGDNARIHNGVIAQDVQQAFTDESLDAGDYALFISTTWWETQTEVPAVEAVEEVLDEEGNVVTEAVEGREAYTRTDTYNSADEAPEGATTKTRMGIRYPQLLSFLAAYNEQRFSAIEARLDALEA